MRTVSALLKAGN